MQHRFQSLVARPKYRLYVVALVLLIIAASRIIRLRGLERDVDEIWSIWQTFGTPQQIVLWTPYDWPPLFYLIVGAWKSLVGIHPFAIRILPIFVFLLSTALLYRVSRKLFGGTAALLTITAYGGLGYAIYLSVLLRGYVFLAALMPLALWLVIKYFECPSLQRAVPLGVCFALMFYIHFSAFFGYAMLGLYTLIVYRREIWRWWLPGVIAAVLAGPEIIASSRPWSYSRRIRRSLGWPVPSVRGSARPCGYSL